jgi:hypothetical protein
VDNTAAEVDRARVLNFQYWHIADIDKYPSDVLFQGMLTHAPRNSASGSRSISHVTAIAYVPSAPGLIWPHVGAKNDALLLGDKCFLSRPIQ